MIRVLIIEDDIIFARTLQQSIARNFDWEVRIALDKDGVFREFQDLKPQLILCDINLGEPEDGLTLVQQLQKEASFEVIFITSYQSQELLERAAGLRAAGYILKPIKENEFRLTMKMAEGRLSVGIGRALETPVKNPLPNFTRTETEVLRLIAEHLPTQAIAEKLHVSPLTIKNHRHNISKKLHLPPGNNSILKWTMAHKELL